MGNDRQGSASQPDALLTFLLRGTVVAVGFRVMINTDPHFQGIYRLALFSGIGTIYNAVWEHKYMRHTVSTFRTFMIEERTGKGHEK